MSQSTNGITDLVRRLTAALPADSNCGVTMLPSPHPLRREVDAYIPRLTELLSCLDMHCRLLIDHGHTTPDSYERELVRAFKDCGGLHDLPPAGRVAVGLPAEADANG